MRGNARGVRGTGVTLLVAGSLLAGCSAQGMDGGSARKSASPSADAGTGATAGATTAPSGSALFTADPALVPKTAKDGAALADAVVLAPADWGRGFVAQQPAASTPGTWAVLDAGCRWEREKLPSGVLASSSRYSRLPAGGGKGAVKVTAAATVHASVLGADEQLSTTLEEVLRCPDQQPRGNERITGLNSLGTPFGTREQGYADDSVMETGQYAENGGAAQPYSWMVARLGTVVVAVSVTGAKGNTAQELNQVGAVALAKMLERIQLHLKGN
ncbi:hypothetical protein ABZ490_05070 [Streptomyces sp. NPDC005811]|uniref:hypothetical protein n=1 Tax=Streptomyces sp. NPDC005811 TaxID=3154565 RepID=UPI0033DA37AF